MAMAAAQAVAEAALREARAREQANGGSNYPQEGQTNRDTGNGSMLGGETRFLESLTAANARGQQDNLIQELLGLPMNENEGTANQLLQLLAQQQQGQQNQFSGAPEPMFNTRPNEHYLTIAQNGMYDLYPCILCFQ